MRLTRSAVFAGRRLGIVPRWRVRGTAGVPTLVDRIRQRRTGSVQLRLVIPLGIPIPRGVPLRVIAPAGIERPAIGRTRDLEEESHSTVPETFKSALFICVWRCIDFSEQTHRRIPLVQLLV